jgi:DNA-binding CsgD family transcriptional regulator
MSHVTSFAELTAVLLGLGESPLGLNPIAPEALMAARAAPIREAMPRLDPSTTRPLCAESSRRIEALTSVLAPSAANEPTEEACGPLAAVLESLSRREWDVCVKLLRGESCKQIGMAMGIGLPTVSKHRSRLFRKLRVSNTVELIHLLYRLVWSGANARNSPRNVPR